MQRQHVSLWAKPFRHRRFATASAVLLLLAPASGALCATPSVSFVLPPNQPPIVEAVDVTVDPAGNLYVLMAGQVNHLMKVDATGRVVWAIGGRGSGDGQFNSPQGVAIGPSGTIYVVERGNDRVQYFDRFGAFLGKFGSRCFLPSDPYHSCVDPDGGGPLQLGDGQFFQPTGIDVDSAGRIYVADYNNHRIQVFSAPGVPAFKFGSLCVLDPTYPEVGAGCVDPDGNGPLALGDGQFRLPEGIAVDNSGRIIVADSDNNRVQVFDSAGTLLFKVGKNGGSGESGGGDGEFGALSDVATDGTGRIIAANGGRVQVFSPQGEFEHDFTCPSSTCPPELFEGVAGLAVDGTGQIVIADPALSFLRVHEFHGALVKTIGNRGSAAGQFDGVSDVAVGPDGKIYVADFGNDKVQVYTPSGAFITSVQAPQTAFPDSIAVGHDGRLHVSRTFSDAVYVLSPTGQLLFSVGGGARCDLSTGVNCVDPDGAGPLEPGDGQFVNQEGVAVDSDGRIYVADNGNDRVQVFDSAGRFLFKFGRNGGDGTSGTGDGEFLNPRGIAVDAGGRIYVADTRNQRLQVFDSAGRFLFKIGRNGGDGSRGSGPGEFYRVQDVAVDASGRIYVVDSSSFPDEHDNHRIQVFSPSGAFLQEFGVYGLAHGAFRFPDGIAVGPDGRVVVADSGNSRVQVFHDPAADLSLSIQGPATVVPGAAFAYVIRVDNHGPATAKNVGVTDTLPEGVSFLGDTVETGWCMVENGQTTCGGSFDSNICLESGGVVRCGLPDLPDNGGGKVTLSVRVAPTARGAVTNHASTAAVTSDPDPSNNDGVVVTQVTDVTPPQVQLPADITAEATSPAGARVTYVATATDDVDGSLAPLCTPPSGATFALGQTPVTCTATDAAGNSASGSFDITVVDTTAPALQAPLSLTVEATGPQTSVALGTPIVSDAADPNPVAAPSNTGPFALGTHTITWTAVDASGNRATALQTVTVRDTTPPALTPPPDRVVEATAPLTPVVLGLATATDLADPNPVVSTSTIPLFPPGVHVVVWTAVDASGNTSTANQSVTVLDTTPPIVAPPPDILATVTGALTPVALGTATAVDVVDGALDPSPSDAGPFAAGTHAVTWTAIDGHGNVGTATQQVVLRYAVSAFLGNLLPLPATNVARAGSTVPVRWQISDGQGGYIRDLSAVSAVRFAETTCDGTSYETVVDAQTSGDSGLRYDLATEEFQYNWKTERGLSGRCYVFMLELADGTQHLARFRLR
jgi:uncharacterized repeat protein (TIGR01451 family)